MTLIINHTQTENIPHNCVIDNGTSHTILRDPRFFSEIIPLNRLITTITGQKRLEEGYGPTTIILPNRTVIRVKSAIYAPTATQNLISFRDVRDNELHIHTSIDADTEVLHILKQSKNGMEVREILPAKPLGLYITQITTYYTTEKNSELTETWHNRLGHPGLNMYQKIIKDIVGIPVSVKPSTFKNNCLACSQGKLIIRPSISKTLHAIPKFL